MRIGNWHLSFYNVRKHRPVVYGIDYMSGHDRVCRPFAEADIQSILMMISDRLANVVWASSPQYDVLKSLFLFVHNNRFAILRKMFYDGFVAVDVSNPFVPKFTDVSDMETMKDAENLVFLLEEIFRTTGKTRAEVLKPHIDMLNTINDSDLNLIYNYGAMGVMSPENSAHSDGVLTDKQRKEIEDEYHTKYGTRFGKWAVLITRNPVKFQRIELPIRELQLVEKRKTAIAEILQYVNVPKELHALFESAKYANRNEAELDMYGNCVTSWAWGFTELIKRCYDKIRLNDKKIGYSANIEIWFDIVGVPALQEAQRTEKEKAREELKAWLELRTALPEKSETINERIDNLIENL